jgi:hypothetical protein
MLQHKKKVPRGTGAQLVNFQLHAHQYDVESSMLSSVQLHHAHGMIEVIRKQPAAPQARDQLVACCCTGQCCAKIRTSSTEPALQSYQLFNVKVTNLIHLAPTPDVSGAFFLAHSAVQLHTQQLDCG